MDTFYDEPSWDECSVHDVGDLIADRYELLSPIGAGGMGVVWRARDRVLRRDIALKLVRADRRNPMLGMRLLTEARAAAAVSHPCVVDIIDLGTTDGEDAYLVMELLNGRELDERLDDGPLPRVEAVSIVAALADALAEAHRAGVVHRDIKASNVLMAHQPDGSVRPILIDFGIARLVETSNDVRLTVTGNLLGTPTYMSPEQAAGSKTVDHRTDLWSLCVLLYELACGLPPFEGESYNEVLKKILMDDPPPLAAIRPGDDELWSIVARGLDKDVETRWQSAERLRDALDAWLVSQGVTEDAVGRALFATTLVAPPPSAREDRFDSIEPTVVGLPSSVLGQPMVRDPRATLTAALSTRSIVAVASVLAALVLVVITTRAPAAELGVRAELTAVPSRAAAAVVVDVAGEPRREPPRERTDQPSRTSPSKPTAAPEPPAAPARETVRFHAPRAPSRKASRARTPMDLPLPSHPNF